MSGGGALREALRLARPLLFAALAVGTARFVLSVAHAPRPVVYAASLTAVELAGMIYLGQVWAQAQTWSAAACRRLLASSSE